MVEHIPESFCTNKQNYVDSSVKYLQEDETVVDTDEENIIP